MTKSLFFVGVLLAAAGILSPPLALVAGLAYGLLVVHPYARHAHRLSRSLLQASVVCLGFGMNLGQVVKVGSSGLFYTAFGIVFALSCGLLLGSLLQVNRTQSFLISAGTAICGGSAIAALGPVTNAGEEEMAVSVGTVFVLNSVALLLFPAIGAALHLSQTQFGLWAALAIHDTSSVVGAAAKYGSAALTVGTTVKLARALWIVPLVLGVAAVQKTGSRVKLPWFILFFVLAAVVNSYLPWLHFASIDLARLGRRGLAVTLFLIGTGMTKQMIRQVGARPMIQGVLLWGITASLSLWAIVHGWIHL